jgi:hypothetical protein
MLIFTANGEVLLLSKESDNDRSEITKRVTDAKLLSDVIAKLTKLEATCRSTFDYYFILGV